MIEVRALTFDATGTLLHSPQRFAIYTEVLNRHGLRVTVDDVTRLFPLVWQELDCLTPLGKDRFASHAGGARGWWRRFLERLCEHLELPAPSPFAAAELFDRFRQPDAWEVYADVVPVLAALRHRGMRLGVVANWDERLSPLLDALDLGRYFDAVVVSAALGIAKPTPEIFRHALRALEVEAAQALHVGDNRREDVEGAIAAGMNAVLLDRQRHGQGVDDAEIDNLGGLLRVLPGARSAWTSGGPASRTPGLC